MTWIKTVAFEDATSRLKKLYDRIKGPDDNVDNIMLAHSLRPHTMEGHMALYKNVLHHSGNTIPKSFLEAIGVYVSLLNECAYCVDHHFAGMKRILNDDNRADSIRVALASGELTGVFTGKEACALEYVRALTEEPSVLGEVNLDIMRTVGWTDGEILEINQVTAYFAYANRTVLGLGVTTEGDIIGLSPTDSSDPENWHHQ